MRIKVKRDGWEDGDSAMLSGCVGWNENVAVWKGVCCIGVHE